ELRQVVGREADLYGAEVVVEVLDLLRAGDRDDVLPLGQHPGESKLARRAPLRGRHALDLFYQLQVLPEVLALEPGRVAAVVVGRQVVDGLETSGQKTAAERAVGDEADPQLAHGRQDFILHLTAPKRILRLQSCDRMSLRGPADCRRRG